MFEKIKEEIINLIKENKDKEINTHSNNSNKGIYMLYIDNFDDDKIIPFYIGQTGCGKNRNFQTRYKEHLEEIMSLNRLNYEYYKKLLLDNFYDGHYKTCKIFQYMVDHNCTLKDFHMIPLEEINAPTDDIQQILNEKEQSYFSKYLPAFFGFNQTNTVVEDAKYRFNNYNKDNFIVPQDILNYELEDCENFINYFGYGYTKFNYYHCFPKALIDEEKNNEVITKINEKKQFLKDTYYDENKFKMYYDKIIELNKEKEKVVKDIENYDLLFEQKYNPEIKRYCEHYKISISQKYKEIKQMLIYQNSYNIESFEKYLKRKKIEINILDVLNADKEFLDLKNKYIDNQSKYYKLSEKINEYKNINKIDDLLRIMPKKEYKVLPLKDKYEEIEFDYLGRDSLIINFEFSNNGNEWTTSYSLLKMDFKLNIDGMVIEQKNIFIKSLFDNNSYIMHYQEKDDTEKFFKMPFHIRNYPDYISTTMEVQNGINEYTLMNKEKFDFILVMDQINSLITERIDVQLKVRYRMKNKFKEYIRDNYTNQNLLKKKILESK